MNKYRIKAVKQPDGSYLRVVEEIKPQRRFAREILHGKYEGYWQVVLNDKYVNISPWTVRDIIEEYYKVEASKLKEPFLRVAAHMAPDMIIERPSEKKIEELIIEFVEKNDLID